MSWWTHIHGTIEVSVSGRTQPEVEYVLKTVLSHLPKVTGSEGGMHVHLVQCEGWDSCSCGHDEFGLRANNLKHDWWMRDPNRGDLEVQHRYLLVIHASLRDRFFEQTKRELLNWLCRLAKRVYVEEILLRLSAYDQAMLLDKSAPFKDMYEEKDSWTEYLYWERDPQSWWPLKLANKYFDDDYLKQELKRREEWAEKEGGD